jgi:hypothetical protein
MKYKIGQVLERKNKSPFFSRNVLTIIGIAHGVVSYVDEDNEWGFMRISDADTYFKIKNKKLKLKDLL